jgi:hypothetical protein
MKQRKPLEKKIKVFLIRARAIHFIYYILSIIIIKEKLHCKNLLFLLFSFSV